MTEPVDPAIVQLYGTLPASAEDVIVTTTKELARTVPAPRDDPFYGMDRLGGPALRTMQRLTRHGDFRKYVFVLDAGAGLGGSARWLALRFGCRVLALDLCTMHARLIARLSRRTPVGERIRTVAGSYHALPLRDATFTQIWSVEALHHATRRRRAIAELYRVLRPGSPLAMQEIVRRDPAVPQLGGPWRHGTAAEYVEALEAAGFRNIECDDVTAERPETSSVVLSAQQRLVRTLRACLPADAPWHAAQRRLEAVTPTVYGPDYRVLQLFARRPSV